MKITRPTVLIPGNEIDVGLHARLNSNGFVAVTLGMGADPETFTPELVAAEQAGMPGWRFQREYKRVWDAQRGVPVFEEPWLAHQEAGCRDPLWRMDINADGKLEKSRNGRVFIWIDPAEPPPGMPDEWTQATRLFGLGADVGKGVAESDSTCVGFAVDTMEQAVEFRDNTISASDHGRMLAAIGRYLNDALICCVNKMHGIEAIRSMIAAGYARIWRTKVQGHLTEYNAKTIGWMRGEASDDVLFDPWIDAVQYAKIQLRSVTCVLQHRHYIYDQYGRIVHQRLADEAIELRKRHSDLVIAAALALPACRDMPKYRAIERRKPHPRSYVARRRRWEQQQDLAKPRTW